MRNKEEFKMTNYRVVFTDNNGEVQVGFETLSTNNFLVAERILSKHFRKMGGVLLRCEAWFE